MEVEIVGNPAGSGRVEAGSDSVVDWKRPKVNSTLALTEGHGVGVEAGDILFIRGGSSGCLYEIFASMGADPIMLYSWLGANGGGGHYRVGWDGSLKDVRPGEVVHLPSKDKPVLKLRGI